MNLKQFLDLNTYDANETFSVTVGERLKDENGNPFVFKIRALSGSEIKDLTKKCTYKTTENGKKVEKVDEVKLNSSVVVAACVEPNFKDAKALESAGLSTPVEALEKTLKFGEISQLTFKIMDVSGVNTPVQELANEVKN